MLLKFALTAAAATPILHCVVLIMSGQDAVTDPISELSRQNGSGLQTLGLLLFGAAHVALALAMRDLARGRLWPIGRALLGASGVILFYIAWYFTTAGPETLSGPDANDPLWLVASLVGLAMGALQPGLSRLSRQLGLFTAVCLGVWLWLIPLILLVDNTWLGAYERIVGAVYVTWIIGVAGGLLQPAGRSAARY